jgi:hypothetical protein
MHYHSEPHYRDQKVYPAYKCSELGEMLHQTGCYTTVTTVLDGWACRHINDFGEFIPEGINNYTTEAQARAAMLIHLLESKLMPVPCSKEIMGSSA